MTTSQQDMRAEFEEWRLGGTLVSTTNPYKELTQPCQFWSFEAWQHRQQELDALQAKLDAVMLEYCPEEMTQEQTEKWASSQVVSDKSELDAARLEVERLRLSLEELACLGNGDRYGNSIGNEIAIKALAAQQENG